jgi:FkbM family methyltransferase
MRTFAVALALFAVGCDSSSPRLAALWAMGRSPHCPLGNAVQTAAHWRLMTEAKDRILAGSKLLEKDAQGFRLWQTPYGRFWIPDGSDYVLPFNLAEQERKIYGDGEQAVRTGDVVVDCGANVGVFTRAALAAGARTVVAIEPAPENILCLRRNFEREIASGAVILIEKGVWDKDDMLTLRVDPHNSAADSFVIHREDAHEGARAPLTTLDKIVRELKLERVDFIKMDIEGAEQRALAGARETLAKHRPRLALSAYHNAEDPARIPEIVRQAWSGYTMECGPCTEANGRIRPDILYFR